MTYDENEHNSEINELAFMAGGGTAMLRYKLDSDRDQENEEKVADRRIARKFIAQKYQEYLEVPENKPEPATSGNELELATSEDELEPAISENELESVKRDIKESLDSLGKIEGLFPVITISRDKGFILRNALRIVSEKLNAQATAIFLINKDGVLERVSIFGVDKNGEEIEPDWYEEETYPIDSESFVGRTAIPEEETGYGRFQFTSDLSSESNIDSVSRERYSEKCGPLGRAIAVPINGRSKTYGVLRVINTIDPISKKVIEDSDFEEIDVVWLSLLSTYISNALSNFRRDLQTKIFQYLSGHLAHSSYSKDNYYEGVLNYYQDVLDLLVKNPETAFKAGVLRLVEDRTQTLRVVATSIFSDDLERDDQPRRIGEGLAGFVAENRQRLIFPDIPKGQFHNEPWVTRNFFKSFSCFPLISRDVVVGTLSLYTGYRYDYHTNSINFLQCIVDSVAAYTLFEFFRGERKLSKLFATYKAKRPKKLEISSLEDVEKLIIRSLIDQPSKEDVPTLLASLASEDTQTRCEAALALGEIGDERAVPDLCRILKTDRDPEVRRTAAQALGMLASKGDKAESHDPEIRRITTETLGILASQGGKAESHDPEIRRITTEALGMLAEALEMISNRGVEEEGSADQ